MNRRIISKSDRRIDTIVDNGFSVKTVLSILILSMVACGMVLSGAALAGSITVDVPSDLKLVPGVPVSLPVMITDASNVAALMFYVNGDESTDVNVVADSSDFESVIINTKTKKFVLLPSDAVTLNGNVRLCMINVTLNNGDKAVIDFDVLEVINSELDDITDLYPGVRTEISLSSGSEVQVKSVASTEERSWSPVQSSSKKTESESNAEKTVWVYDSSIDTGLTEPIVSGTNQPVVSGTNQPSEPQNTPVAVKDTQSSHQNPSSSQSKSTPGFFIPVVLLGLVGAMMVVGWSGRHRK